MNLIDQHENKSPRTWSSMEAGRGPAGFSFAHSHYHEIRGGKMWQCPMWYEKIMFRPIFLIYLKILTVLTSVR